MPVTPTKRDRHFLLSMKFASEIKAPRRITATLVTLSRITLAPEAITTEPASLHQSHIVANQQCPYSLRITPGFYRI
jgi:hypothetical protein